MHETHLKLFSSLRSLPQGILAQAALAYEQRHLWLSRHEIHLHKKALRMLSKRLELGRASFISRETPFQATLSASICIEGDANHSELFRGNLYDAVRARRVWLQQGQSLHFLVFLSFDSNLSMIPTDQDSLVSLIEKSFADCSVGGLSEERPFSDSGRYGNISILPSDVLHGPASLRMSSIQPYLVTDFLSSFDATADS